MQENYSARLLRSFHKYSEAYDELQLCRHHLHVLSTPPTNENSSDETIPDIPEQVEAARDYPRIRASVCKRQKRIMNQKALELIQ